MENGWKMILTSLSRAHHTFIHYSLDGKLFGKVLSWNLDKDKKKEEYKNGAESTSKMVTLL